jgi:hypothetical protein
MVANGLAQHIDSVGIATLGDDLTIRVMPDNPDNVITLFDEAGAQVLQESHTFDEDMFGMQVMTRGSYDFAHSKILEIHRELTNITGTFDGIEIRQTTIQTSPSYIENDSDGRAIYTAHYDFHCKIGANTNRKA